MFNNTDYFERNLALQKAWQHKHEVAYWKSKAMSLAHENKILHGIVKNGFSQPLPLHKSFEHGQRSNESLQKNYSIHSQAKVLPQSQEYHNESDNETESEYECGSDSEGEDNLEVSEEFLQFLRANVYHKMEVAKEKEKLKIEAQLRGEVEDVTKLEAAPGPLSEETTYQLLEDIYGKSACKINYLELITNWKFDKKLSEAKYFYWPNIPLNL